MATMFNRRKRPVIEAIGQLMVLLSVVGAVLYGGGWYPAGPAMPILFKASAVSFLLLFVFVTGQTANHSILTLALLASVIGDILLEFPTENAFVQGLTAFLIAHVFYIILFLKNRLTVEDKARFRTRTSVLAWVTSLSAISYMYLNGALGNMLVPVVVYTLVITIMVTTALFSRMPVKMVGTGAILFLISDGCIAAREFLDIEIGGPYTVWVTYFLAQLLLTLGVMLYDDRRTNFGGYRFN